MFSVLRYALGAGPAVKYGVGAGPLGKLVADSKEPLGASAFSSAYSDSGLFGIVLSTTSRNAKHVRHQFSILQNANLNNNESNGIPAITHSKM